MKAIRFASLLMVIAALGSGWSGCRARAQAMAEHVHASAPRSTALTLELDGKARTLSAAELKALPQRTITVHNEHTKRDESYSGVELGDLLAKYGAPFDRTSQKRMLHSYLRVEGTDHYFVLYSVAEVEGSLHAGDVIVATSMDGKNLGEDGAIKLVASGDKKPMRWVRNVTKITLVTVD